MKEFMITDREAGQRFDKYLTRLLDKAPKSFLYKMMRKKNIELNRKKASGPEILKAGDSVRIFFSDETFEKFCSNQLQASLSQEGEAPSVDRSTRVCRGKPDLDIVYEDHDILIINKPAGILSQKAKASDYSVNEMIIDYLLSGGQMTELDLRTFHPSVCNRLDRNTSGLLIAGKTMHGLQTMAKYLKERTVQKYYHAIVWGHVATAGHLTGHLVKDSRTNQVRMTNAKEGSYIETLYRPLAHYPDATLLEIHLITGKTHQIRAHLASIGHPIIGDTKYGDYRKNKRLMEELSLPGQLLCAVHMNLPDGRIIEIPDPEAFARTGQWLSNH